jgi:hypothetical protein
MARVERDLHPLHRRLHLLDDQEIARLGLVQGICQRSRQNGGG